MKRKKIIRIEKRKEEEGIKGTKGRKRVKEKEYKKEEIISVERKKEEE